MKVLYRKQNYSQMRVSDGKNMEDNIFSELLASNISMANATEEDCELLTDSPWDIVTALLQKIENNTRQSFITAT